MSTPSRTRGIAARMPAVPVPLSPGEPAIEADDVHVEINGKAILHGVSLTVRSGEIVALIGPNGAGKSTLLAAITGDLPISGGSIRIAGQPLTEWRLGDLSRRRAVLLQENRVSFSFTVEQVVEMGRTPWRRTEREDEDDDAVAEALGLTDIERFRTRGVPSLSGGERARAGLARVLAQRTGILLLDEPTAALDLRHQEDVLRLASDRAGQGDAVAVVLHDLNLAAAYADRIALLADGLVVRTGSPADVLTSDLIGDVYRQQVDILHHPVSGTPLIVPVRGRTRTATRTIAAPTIAQPQTPITRRRTQP